MVRNQKIPVFNDNENTIQWHLQDTANAVLRGKFIAMTTNTKSTEKSQ
jgi:hypothetical protein